MRSIHSPYCGHPISPLYRQYAAHTVAILYRCCIGWPQEGFTTVTLQEGVHSAVIRGDIWSLVLATNPRFRHYTPSSLRRYTPSSLRRYTPSSLRSVYSSNWGLSLCSACLHVLSDYRIHHGRPHADGVTLPGGSAHPKPPSSFIRHLKSDWRFVVSTSNGFICC